MTRKRGRPRKADGDMRVQIARELWRVNSYKYSAFYVNKRKEDKVSVDDIIRKFKPV